LCAAFQRWRISQVRLSYHQWPRAFPDHGE
jgi:hypothetical protein